MPSITLLPFQPMVMSPAQLAAAAYLAGYSGRTHDWGCAAGVPVGGRECAVHSYRARSDRRRGFRWRATAVWAGSGQFGE